MDLDIVKELLLYNYEATGWIYDNLTTHEQSIISEAEFEQLEDWCNGK